MADANSRQRSTRWEQGPNGTLEFHVIDDSGEAGTIVLDKSYFVEEPESGYPTSWDGILDIDASDSERFHGYVKLHPLDGITSDNYSIADVYRALLTYPTPEGPTDADPAGIVNHARDGSTRVYNMTARGEHYFEPGIVQREVVLGDDGQFYIKSVGIGVSGQPWKFINDAVVDPKGPVDVWRDAADEAVEHLSSNDRNARYAAAEQMYRDGPDPEVALPEDYASEDFTARLMRQAQGAADIPARKADALVRDQWLTLMPPALRAHMRQLIASQPSELTDPFMVYTTVRDVAPGGRDLTLATRAAARQMGMDETLTGTHDFLSPQGDSGGGDPILQDALGAFAARMARQRGLAPSSVLAQPGQTLDDIARENGLTVEDIRAFNPVLGSLDRIAPGVTVNLVPPSEP